MDLGVRIMQAASSAEAISPPLGPASKDVAANDGSVPILLVAIVAAIAAAIVLTAVLVIVLLRRRRRARRRQQGGKDASQPQPQEYARTSIGHTSPRSGITSPSARSVYASKPAEIVHDHFSYFVAPPAAAQAYMGPGSHSQSTAQQAAGTPQNAQHQPHASLLPYATTTPHPQALARPASRRASGGTVPPLVLTTQAGDGLTDTGLHTFEDDYAEDTAAVRDAEGDMAALECALEHLAAKRPPGLIADRFAVLRDRVRGGQALVQMAKDSDGFFNYAIKCALQMRHAECGSALQLAHCTAFLHVAQALGPLLVAGCACAMGVHVSS